MISGKRYDDPIYGPKRSFDSWEDMIADINARYPGAYYFEGSAGFYRMIFERKTKAWVGTAGANRRGVKWWYRVSEVVHEY
jgi:hypothetical protein